MLKTNLKKSLSIVKQQFQLLDEIPETKTLENNRIRLIKICLYLSSRYSRYLLNNWQKSIKPKRSDPYFLTAEFFGLWFCHASARAIQKGKFDEQLLLKTPSEYFYGDVTTDGVGHVSMLKSYLQAKPAPQIIHLAKTIEGKYAPIHTLIYLGTHPKYGDFVFEKEAAFEHFKITSVNTIIDYYPGFHWIFKDFTDSV